MTYDKNSKFKLNKVILCISGFIDASKCKWNPKETINYDLEVFGKYKYHFVFGKYKYHFAKSQEKPHSFSKRKRRERPKNLFEVKILLGLYSKNAQLSSLAFLFLVLPYNPHKSIGCSQYIGCPKKSVILSVNSGPIKMWSGSGSHFDWARIDRKCNTFFLTPCTWGDWATVLSSKSYLVQTWYQLWLISIL